MKPAVWVAIGAGMLLLVLGSTAAAAPVLAPVLPSIPSALDFATDILPVLNPLLQRFEGFSAAPYWDVSRYSWGYGTAAPGPSGSISRDQALADADAHAAGDYDILSGLITRNLTVNQWAALLSFSYNEGVGAAEKLVDDINAADDNTLEAHWKEYIYAAHEVNQDLVTRRDMEWQVWVS